MMSSHVSITSTKCPVMTQMTVLSQPVTGWSDTRDGTDEENCYGVTTVHDHIDTMAPKETTTLASTTEEAAMTTFASTTTEEAAKATFSPTTTVMTTLYPSVDDSSLTTLFPMGNTTTNGEWFTTEPSVPGRSHVAITRLLSASWEGPKELTKLILIFIIV